MHWNEMPWQGSYYIDEVNPEYSLIHPSEEEPSLEGSVLSIQAMVVQYIKHEFSKFMEVEVCYEQMFQHAIKTEYGLKTKYGYRDALIIIKYNHIQIENEEGDRDFLKDYFFIISVSPMGAISVGGWRQKVQLNHVISGYLHSHQVSTNYMYDGMCRGWCTGDSSTPFGRAMSNWTSLIHKSRFKLGFSAANNGELMEGMTEEERDEIVNRFDYCLSELVGAINPLLQSESIEGVPYNYLRNNKYTQSSPCLSDDSYKHAKEFANLIIENLDSYKIKLNISSSRLEVVQNNELKRLAKDLGYYKKIYALWYYGIDPDEYDEDFHNEDDISGHKLLLSELSTNYSEVNIELAKHRISRSFSPFIWRGERLKGEILYIDTTHIESNDNKSQIHEYLLDTINNELTQFIERVWTARSVRKF